MKRYRAHIIIVVAALLLAGVIGYLLPVPGVHVTVQNTGQETMRDVTVHVTGRSHSFGDLAPGGSRTRTVLPTSASGVEVEFLNVQDARFRLNAGGYFEPGYRGHVDIEIREGKVIAVKNEVRISLYESLY